MSGVNKKIVVDTDKSSQVSLKINQIHTFEKTDPGIEGFKK